MYLHEMPKKCHSAFLNKLLNLYQFKGLDLIDRVPDELWMDVHDIVQETGINHPQEKEMQKSKMAVSGGLTNSYEKKRREKQRRKGKI